MSSPHYLCSDLVQLTIGSTESTVNLEEIWREGAVLECEHPVEEGSAVEMRGGTASFSGHAIQVERHEFGWRVNVEFSPPSAWDLEQFQPRHLLDESELG
jgi:hypothetical protein